MIFTLKTGVLQLQVCTDSMIRVRYSPTATIPTLKDFVVMKTAWPAAAWEMKPTDKTVTLTTARMSATVLKEDGAIVFKDAAGHELLSDGPRQMIPAEVDGESTYHSEDVFKIYGSEEAFYGLGQHQAGVWNFRGESVELSQENTNIAVPMWLSSKGYGVFWNNRESATSTTASSTLYTSARTWQIPSSTTSSTGRNSTRSSPTTAN